MQNYQLPDAHYAAGIKHTGTRRIIFLFDLYEQYTAGLFAEIKKKRKT